MSGRGVLALLLAAHGCALAGAFECDAHVLHQSGGSLVPTPGASGECLPALFGPHIPFNADFDRPLVRASPADGCAELSGPSLTGSIALFVLGSCSAHDAALRAQARGAVAAVFATRADQPFRRSTAGWLGSAPTLTIPVLLVTHAFESTALTSATTHLRLRLAARELHDGAALSGSLAAERDGFYTYSLAERADLTVVVFAAAGDPDLYGNHAPTLEAVALPPGTFTAQFQAAHPGDDLITIRNAEAGAYVFAVNSFSQPANFTIQLASGRAELALSAGQPMRLAVGRSELRYLKHTFALGADGTHPSLRFALTAFTGNVTLWVCKDFQPAPEGRSSCAWTTSGRSAPVLDILPADPHALRGCSAACTYHLILRAQAAASVAVSVSRDGGAIALVDGAPQVGMVGPARQTSRYTIRTTDGALDLSATPTRGAMELRVREPHGGRTTTLTAAAGSGGSVLRRAFTAAELCADCDVEIEAVALREGSGGPFGECVYSLSAATSQGIVTLEDGVPRLESVSASQYVYFRTYVQDAATDLRLILTPISGNPDLYVSHLVPRPNATHHELSAASATGNDVVSILHTDAPMANCIAGGAAQCVWYVSVFGQTASTFTVSALLSVANDGLRIDKPVSARSDLVFTNAVFGTPLPFVGTPRTLVAVTPRDACAELGSSSLSGKIALIDRGDCVFVDKVLRAQAKGAVGVIVVNNADGAPVRMGMPAEPPSETVRIPAVMISRADGDRLRGLLGAGSVEMVMQQPGDRPLQLLDGVPQESHVESSQMLFFSFYAQEGIGELRITVTPEVGDADLYVANDGLPPTQTHFGWFSSMSGEDSVTIGRSDARFCDGCVYHIGVYGYTAASFSVVASTEQAAVLLQLGMPVTAHLRADEWAYYTVQIEDASSALRISVTPLTGDPDLYVSTEGRPSRANHIWAATSWGGDTLVIQPTAPGFRPGTFTIGVSAFVNTTYTLTATLDGEQAMSNVLIAGRPQTVSVGAHEWQYFRFSVGPNATRVAFNVVPVFGDPDLYVTTDGSTPTKQHYSFSANRMGVELIEATPTDAGFCADCAYLLGVYGFTPSNFTLSALVDYRSEGNATDGGTITLLSDGLPVEGLVGTGESRYFRFFIDRTDMAVNVTLTAYSGDPDLYASFSVERPTAASHSFASSSIGGDTLSISHFSANFCQAAACSLHIGVHGASEARFAIVVSQYEEVRLTLIDGMPQHAAVAGQAWQYYTFTLSDNATSVRFSISPSFGDPDLYVSTAQEPTRDAYQWASSSSGSDEIVIDHLDPLWAPPPTTYRVGVYAWRGATNYTIVAASQFAQTLLEDGVPNRGSVRPNAYEYFKVYVDDNATDLEVIVTPLAGDPDVFASHSQLRPNLTSHEFASTSGERDMLNIEHTRPEMASCTAGARRCVFYVSVYGAGDQTASFQIVAALHVTNRGMRVTRPPAIARLFSNRAALFGPPLPFDGVERRIVATEPADACAPLTNAAALRGHVALASRGDCFFTDKALAAQAAGARALVVSNTDSFLLFMATNSMEAAGNVTIPAVMINQGDGDALRAVLASAEVYAVLEQHGDRPRRLVEGLPQYGRAVLWEMVYYRFTVGDQHRDVTFTLTPAVGSVDLFVRRADDGLPPTQSFYDLSSTLAGSLPDMITIRASDAEWCADCTFIVGVLGWSPAEYTLVASTSETIVALQDGVPHLSHLDASARDFYRVDVTNPTQKLRILLTPINGDPDLYVSTIQQRPDATNYTWASTAFGGESLTISHDDPNFRLGAFYLGVKAFTNTTYTVTAMLDDDSCLQLVDGQPQQASLARGEWECFEVSVGARASALSVTATPLFGDPDIYVTSDGTRPSQTNWHFRSSHLGADEVEIPISAGGEHACAGCTYQIGVYAFSATNFTLQATTSLNSSSDESGPGGADPRGHRVLTDSVPTTTLVSDAQPAYFAYYVNLATADVQVRLTRLSGSVTLAASFADTYPSATGGSAQWSVGSSMLTSEMSITISAGDSRRCSPVPCVLYLAVEAEGYATVSLLAFQESLELIALIDGRPQQDSLARDGARFYSAHVPANATSLTVTLTAFSGDPDIFVSNTPGVRPHFGQSTWSATRLGSDSVRIAATDPFWCHGGCTFTIGVVASSASNYSLVASTGFAALPPVVVLQDGTPMQQDITEPDGYAFFRFPVDNRNAAVVVTVTPFSGDPDIYASFNATRPQQRMANVISSLSLGGDVLRISHFDASFCPLGPAEPCVLHIGVHAFNGNCSFSILATQANESAVALVDGVPQQASLELRRWQYFTFAVGQGASRVSVSVTPSNGDPDVYISTKRFPTASEYEWRSTLSGGETVRIEPSDERWCTDCSYRIGVYAFSATNFSVTATTGASAVLLEDGVPRTASVAAGAYDYYRVLVEDVSTDLHLVLTAISGNADLYISHTHERPNATHYEFRSTAIERDAVSVMHYDSAMAACTGGATRCTFFVSVYGVNASTYSLSARLSVATSGLRVDEPAEVAGGLVFTNAVFGPPLPFDGESRRLVEAEPFDGCSALSGGSLSGKIALIERGTCFFSDKVRNAQAKGASAVLVMNNLDGPPVRMGAPNAAAAIGLDVPAVMISKADGDRLRALITAGTAVSITLQQPGDRPQLLVEGMPQHASVGVAQMLYFKFYVGAEQAEADVTFAVTADFGDPDVYVSSDGLPPTQTHYGAVASRFGADSITLGPADAAHCFDCMYYVGVYGWSASNFTIVASTATGITTLQLGVPTSGRLGAGERASYRIFVDDRSEALRIALTPLTGDPDLYVSTTTQHPSAAEHTWASTRVGDDSLFISASDPRFGSGVFFIGVVAASNTSYSISAAVSGELRLFHGRPQRASLPADEWQYLVFSVPAGARAFTLTVTAAFGDPDLYVRTGSRPTLTEHGWSASTSGGDTLTVRSDDPHWCAPPCTYYAGVYAWSSTNFSIVQVIETEEAANGTECGSSGMELEDGVVVYAVARANASKCFRLQIDRPDDEVTVTLTPFSGEARLAAGFGGVRAATEELRGLVSVVGTATGSSVLLTPDCAAAALAQAGGCSLHVRVSSEQDCSFSLAATQAASGRAVSLTPGRPQYGSLAQGGWSYYSFATHADARVDGSRPALTLSLAPAFGDPNMYVRADGILPSAASFTWASTAAGGDHLLIGGDDARACGGESSCRFLIAVRAASATNFSLTGYTHGSIVTVQEGLPLTAVAPAHQCTEFMLSAAGAASAELAVALTALSGEPDVYVDDRPHPSAAAHLPGGQMRVGANSGELRVPLSGPSGPRAAGAYYVSVCSGADNTACRFVLSMRLRSDTPPLLMDGKPFATSVADRRLEEFRFAVGPHAARMQVTASPRSGDVALLLSPRGAGHDAPGAGGSALSAAVWRSSVPGVNTIVARSTDAGWCAPCEYAVGVLGQPASNFTLLVTLERAYTLRDGEPQVAQLLHHGGPLVQHAAYFAYSLDEPVGFSIIVTVYMGSPDVFVSTSDARPSAASFEWQPSSAFDAGGGGIRQVTIKPADASFCTGCTYYVGVLAYGNASVAVTASSERARTLSLVNGLPLKQSTLGGEYLYFTTELGAEGGDLTIAVQSEVGDPDLDIFVSADGLQPSSESHGWASASRLDDEDQVTIRRSDEGYCAGCTYTIAVYGTHASTFSIVATTSSGTTLLPLGLPSQQRVPVGSAAYFKAIIDPHGPEALLTLLAMRAPLRVHLSTTTTQPSDDFSLAALDAPLGAPTRFLLDAVRLRQWCAERALIGGMCPLYIAVRSGAAEDATFSLSVAQGSATVLIPGMPQVASADPTHPALFSVGAAARDADLAISVSMQAPADAVESITLELRVSKSGFLPEDDEEQWRTTADSSRGGTASVFIARDDPLACHSCTYHITVLVRAKVDFTLIASTERGHTLLVEGGVVHSSVGKDEYALFKTYVNRAATRPLVLTVHPCAGNPDLFVSDVVLRPGLPASYTFASAQLEQVERILLAPAALSKLGEVLYISVYGQTAAVFTISVGAQPEEERAALAHSGPSESAGILDVVASSPRRAQVSWQVAHALGGSGGGNGSAAVPHPELDRDIEYSVELAEVGAAPNERGVVLFTTCGISESAHVAATRTQSDGGASGKITARLDGLKPATSYQVNVLASRKGTGEPLLYRPVAFSTLSASEALGGGAIAAIVLGSLLGCVLVSLALIIVRRRKQLASLTLLNRDEAVDMYHLGNGGQLETIGPLVASPLFGGMAAAEEGVAPLAPYEPRYEPTGGEASLGDMLAASLNIHHAEPELAHGGEVAGGEVAERHDAGPAPSHRPLGVSMDSDSDEGGSDDGGSGNGDGGMLMDSAQGRSDE